MKLSRHQRRNARMDAPIMIAQRRFTASGLDLGYAMLDNGAVVIETDSGNLLSKARAEGTLIGNEIAQLHKDIHEWSTGIVARVIPPDYTVIH